MRAMLMNGAGNAFLLADARGQAGRVNPSERQVRAWAVQHGFDQFLLLENSDGADAFMRIWNADGEEAGACGNGARAAGWALMDQSGADLAFIDSESGRLEARMEADGRVTVDLGPPRLVWDQIPLAREMDTVELDFIAEAAGVRIERPGAVSMGNPHAVFFVRDLDGLPVEALGREVEHDPLFPQRVNAGFVQIYDPSHIRLRVWERGAGLTQACGTGACAAVVAGVRRGLLQPKCEVAADGGLLKVEWSEVDGHVHLTGPVELEGETEIAL